MSLSESPTPAAPPPATIVIVGYRAYEELELCLTSLARFEPALPVVVVDHDADEVRGRAITSRFAQVRYLPRAENHGFGAGVNAGAGLAGPGPLLLINPDCVLTAPLLAPLLAVLDDPGVGVVGGLLRDTSGAVQASARRFPDVTTAIAGRTSWLSRHLPGNSLSRRNLVPHREVPVAADWVSGALMLVRRETFDRLGGFDPGFFLYCEDTDLCRRARDAGWSTVYAPTAAVVHHTARSSRYAPTRSLWAFHRSALRYYLKHGGWLARAASPFIAVALLGRFLLRLPGRLGAATSTPAGRRRTRRRGDRPRSAAASARPDRPVRAAVRDPPER